MHEVHIPLLVTAECREMLAAGASLEEIIAHLRALGLGKVPSIGVIAEISGNSLTTAKNLVHFSQAWADVKEQDEELHAKLDRVLGSSKRSKRRDIHILSSAHCMPMKKRETAAELMARLRADPSFVAREKEGDAALQRRQEEYARAEAPLVQELRAAAVAIGSVWDLVNAINTYPQSLPILLDHLRRPYPDAIRDGIARALATPGAKFAWPALVKLYQQEQGERTRLGLAVALSNIADDEVMGELIALAHEPQLGGSRILLLGALRRSRLPQARSALEEFGLDPMLQNEALRLLRRMKRVKQ